jgi:hypothetical protein
MMRRCSVATGLTVRRGWDRRVLFCKSAARADAAANPGVPAVYRLIDARTRQPGSAGYGSGPPVAQAHGAPPADLSSVA